MSEKRGENENDGAGKVDKPLQSDELLPMVYEELRKLATSKLSRENPGQTLQSTALVHEAYIRLLKQNGVSQWDSKGHFFAAAAEAMRRILVDRAREKKRLKRGGDRKRVNFSENDTHLGENDENVLLINESIESLERDDPKAAEVLKLRYYAGLSVEEAAKALDISRASAYRHWSYARAWVVAEIVDEENSDNSPGR